MNIGSGWSNFTATTNHTQFNPKSNNLQRNGALTMTITLAHLIGLIQKITLIIL